MEVTINYNGQAVAVEVTLMSVRFSDYTPQTEEAGGEMS